MRAEEEAAAQLHSLVQCLVLSSYANMLHHGVPDSSFHVSSRSTSSRPPAIKAETRADPSTAGTRYSNAGWRRRSREGGGKAQRSDATIKDLNHPEGDEYHAACTYLV